jgi:hypothetical protein
VQDKHALDGRRFDCPGRGGKNRAKYEDYRRDCKDRSRSWRLTTIDTRFYLIFTLVRITVLELDQHSAFTSALPNGIYLISEQFEKSSLAPLFQEGNLIPASRKK